MSLTVPPAASPDNQIRSSGLTVPANLPKNSTEIPIPPNTRRVILKGHDTYKGIPGDGVVPG